MEINRKPPVNDFAVFADLWNRPGTSMPPAVARYILRLRFSDEENGRVLDLVRRHKSTGLTANEIAEMDAYLKAADMLAILWSKARMALNRKKAAKVK